MGKTFSLPALLCVATLPACALVGRSEAPADDEARERTFELGLDALERADFTSAAAQLATVAAICPVDAAGRRAMLLLAAAELDPRNAAARPGVAAELAAFQLARPTADEAWAAPLARELYVLALDYGADSVATGAVPGADVLWSHYLGGPVRPADGSARGVGADEPLGVASSDSLGVATIAAGGQVAGMSVAYRGGPLCDVPHADVRVSMPRLTSAPSMAAGVDAGATPDPGAGVENADARALMAEVTRLRGELAAREQELDRIRRTLRP